MVAKEITRLSQINTMKKRKKPASKVISVELGLKVYRFIKEQFSKPVYSP
jgi:uncharacterized HAD superfamily protein